MCVRACVRACVRVCVCVHLWKVRWLIRCTFPLLCTSTIFALSKCSVLLFCKREREDCSSIKYPGKHFGILMIGCYCSALITLNTTVISLHCEWSIEQWSPRTQEPQCGPHIRHVGDTHTADTLTFMWIRYIVSRAITLGTHGEGNHLGAAPGSHEPTVLCSLVGGSTVRDWCHKGETEDISNRFLSSKTHRWRVNTKTLQALPSLNLIGYTEWSFCWWLF